MASALRRPRPFLANLPASDPARSTRDLLRKCTEKFFSPFVQPKRSSADLASYRFKENLVNVLVPDIIDGNTRRNGSYGSGSSGGAFGGSRPHRSGFLCSAQLNGEVGNSRLFEDLFHVILSGFDVVHVNVENKDRCSTVSCVQDPCHFRGFFVLAHTRPFLGWEPSFVELPKDVFAAELPPAFSHSAVDAGAYTSFQLRSHDTLPFVKEAGNTVLLPKTVKVSFSTHAEGSFTSGGSRFLLSHLNLRLRFVDALTATAPAAPRETSGAAGYRLDLPPAAVVEALSDKDTWKLFAGLRRLGVRPELITAETLLSATRQRVAWAKALESV